MVSVAREEILSRFVGIKAVLQTLHKFYSPITCEKFHSSVARSFFCTARIPLCRTKFSHVTSSARLSCMKKFNSSVRKSSQKYISIDPRYFHCILRCIWYQPVRKKFNQFLCRISLFYESMSFRTPTSSQKRF